MTKSVNTAHVQNEAMADFMLPEEGVFLTYVFSTDSWFGTWPAHHDEGIEDVQLTTDDVLQFLDKYEFRTESGTILTGRQVRGLQVKTPKN